MTRTLIAGLGNVFAGDDGFGSAVVRALDGSDLPPGTEICDVGICGVHLAYRLLDRYDLVVLVDAVQRSAEPGTLFVIEHDTDPDRGEADPTAPLLDAHDLGPDGVLALVPLLGGAVPRVVVVGCEPATLAAGMTLSASVASSVEPAAALVISIVKAAESGRSPIGTSLIGGGSS
jgi:hydrogenase maturation protease